MVQEDTLALRRQRSLSPRRSPSPTPKEITQTGIVAGGKQSRVVEIFNEDGTECITIGASGATTTTEVCDVLGWYCQMNPGDLRLISRVGTFHRTQRIYDEVASRVTALGIKSFKRATVQYTHPTVVIGGGLGGIQTMMNLTQRGREDYVCVEKLHDFGGASWMLVANKFTKLQTEKGCYYISYMFQDKECPSHFGDMKYSTWPSRDQILRMMRHEAARYGLYEKTRFNISVEKVKVLPGFANYALACLPTNNDEAGELMMGSSVLAWPGNLNELRLLEFAGEDAFDGYIEYASYCKTDYDQAMDKVCILYGHGAFTIENVRTLCEHRCKKVVVMCRKRNLCGMKIMSWMVGQLDMPVAGNILIEGFQKMYDLVGFDCWTAYSVKTDANHTFAHVSQKTVFGVTDVYFLAGYYGLMECMVDEIKRLTHLTAHTKKGKKVQAEVLLKAVGTMPSFKIDKILGIKELYGLWVNGDPLRPVLCNGMFVEARNFGSFSSGPGFASFAMLITWFVDWPHDFEMLRGKMPSQKPGERPAYVPSATHMLPTMTAISQNIPMLGGQMGQTDGLKGKHMRHAHPTKEYIAQCEAEWKAYIQFFKKHNMVDERPDPPYPYTIENVQDMIDRSNYQWMKRQGMAQ